MCQPTRLGTPNLCRPCEHGANYRPGRAAQLVDDPDRTDIDQLSVQYTGGPYADRAGARVSAWMDVESWVVWNGDAPWQPA